MTLAETLAEVERQAQEAAEAARREGRGSPAERRAASLHSAAAALREALGRPRVDPAVLQGPPEPLVTR